LLPGSPSPDLNSDGTLGEWDAAIPFLDFCGNLIGFDDIAGQEKARKQAYVIGQPLQSLTHPNILEICSPLGMAKPTLVIFPKSIWSLPSLFSFKSSPLIPSKKATRRCRVMLFF
jgi:hypothetical protein